MRLRVISTVLRLQAVRNILHSLSSPTAILRLDWADDPDLAYFS